MIATCRIIRLLLIQLGVASDNANHQDWPVFYATEPDTPDNCITVYDTPGLLDGRLHPTGRQEEHQGIMIHVRSSDYQQGDSKVQEIVQKFNEDVYDTEVTLLDESGTDAQNFTIHSASQRGSINSLGRDTDNASRYKFSTNYIISLLP